ncbi:glycosyltransferase family 4 protein [Paenibacillus sp. SYP-B3998]|uniref:Glycosyltransferase family 4 protein n=1 Tax=Paenibacillus sp. SYP-B3998 TaxID=2678564 RepID=A0A6G3ZT61_9BACL|nr:glycosyltransferase [Paenibacillus sp. SYP-B3998]NEW04779.1 glycosyltransferase family 4 protein [Paenibacillus sp. SYP-B3998]
MTNYEVVWKGPVQKASGLGIASRSYVRALKRHGVSIQVGSAMKKNLREGKIKKRRVLIYHQLPKTINFKKDRASFNSIILNTVWETSRIPNRWVPYMNKFDAVCVPSNQNKQALRNSGVKVPIFLVPHGVDTKMYTPNNKSFPLRGAKGKFIFVSIFGFQHRKNPEALLRAYWEEFSPADNVLLVIKTNGYAAHENEKWIKTTIRRYKERLGIRKKTAPVLVISHYLTSKELKGLYTLGNVFVLPTRGEGVGLPFLESLASGIPVITTGWGGHMDFLTHKNSFLIPYQLQNPVSSMNSKHAISRKFRNLFAEKGQRWAEPNLGSLRRLMRLAYQNPRLCKKKGLQGRKDILKLTWGRAGLSFKQAVEKVIRSKK